MPDPTRIDVAERLDAALDGGLGLSRFDRTDLVGDLLALGEELRAALQAPSLTAVERSRIHLRALDIAGERGHGLRRAWPQLAQLGSHPAVVGGAAAAVLAVAGLVALRERRGHGAPVLHAA